MKAMTLTVVDGDFPREVLASRNLQFGEYRMPSRRNDVRNYDAKTHSPAGKKEGVLLLGALSPVGVDGRKSDSTAANKVQTAIAGFSPYISLCLAALGVALLAAGWLRNDVARRETRRSKSPRSPGLNFQRRDAANGLGGSLVSLLVVFSPSIAKADPCGMVPPVYVGEGQPITRIGDQKTFVFYKDGVETFAIRPGFSGKIDEFGMLIPFPSPPAVRKLPDHVFPHLAAAVDPPEVVVDLRRLLIADQQSGQGQPSNRPRASVAKSGLKYNAVRVVRQEAVGMYQLAVLEAGSAEALKKWMDQHGYKYPDGMDKVAEEYVEDGWCFVAVKSKVGQKAGVDPAPGQRRVISKLPAGAAFDGHVQAMGFRFHTGELVVPMRLSAFNAGELHNVVYLLTDKPQRIRSIPEEYVVRQISGEQLFENLTGPLPLRIIGGTEQDIPTANAVGCRRSVGPNRTTVRRRTCSPATSWPLAQESCHCPLKKKRRNCWRLASSWVCGAARSTSFTKRRSPRCAARRSTPPWRM